MNSHLNNAFTTELEPSAFFLGQNYPNPFKGKTKIKFCVASTTRVTLIVYNSEGKVIKKLVDEEKDPGTYEVEFSIVETGHAPSLRSEIFYCRMEAGEYMSEKKMILMK